MIYENNRSIFHCPMCGRFLASVHATYVGPPGDELIKNVYGNCKIHGEVESKTDWIYEEFFPEEFQYELT